MAHNLTRYIWLALLLVAWTPQLGQAQSGTCSRPDLERAAEDVADARKTLLALPVHDDPGGAETVSPSGVEAIIRMKNRLNKLVVAYLACLPFKKRLTPNTYSKTYQA